MATVGGVVPRMWLYQRVWFQGDRGVVTAGVWFQGDRGVAIAGAGDGVWSQ